MVTQSSGSRSLATCLRMTRTIAVNSALDVIMGAVAALGRLACAVTRPGLAAMGRGRAGTGRHCGGGLPFRIFVQHWRFAGRSDFWRLGCACVLAGVLVMGVLAAVGDRGSGPRLGASATAWRPSCAWRPRGRPTSAGGRQARAPGGRAAR
ncbi:hypothetical protein RAA17_08380 [Komagataeibacter rhaeticus]|nr:hypothetical protein [Komagataeibacter rhaeticus]